MIWACNFLMIFPESPEFLFADSRAASNSTTSLSSFLRPFINSLFVRSSWSIVDCKDSNCRWWFFRLASISSSFSANFRSLVCLSWANSSWSLTSFADSCSRASSASSRASCKSSLSLSSFRLSFSSSTEFLPSSLSCSEILARSAMRKIQEIVEYPHSVYFISFVITCE